ncbi:ATP-dependent DNA ligase [Mycolicibacillus parakoreensis]|uniref:DNA ligase (ATP) n=1 Tax=Mycolicibacillus parakoreensis TaxID=1069221 RepID=A0ABY3U6A9_9MYCO|nr:ATP-dependent DNA ligase [Mycolicibacillus parakoreensis]MCV7314609.1 ATP-dependent DNA ligase [Mycolicibacillus parakoreensis]ULN54404.1 ATP-dependent DNA ligase [Mycolicibacillus parakoreensis]
MGGVDLPVVPPLAPMLATAAAAVPTEAGRWCYQPKWDGFRAVVFRDGDEVVVQSRSGKDLGRYFPELLAALRTQMAARGVLDGEIVVPRRRDGRTRLDWEALSQRIHPAASRVALLAEQTPAHFIAFDAVATGQTALLDAPLTVRARALAALLCPVPPETRRCHRSTATDDPAVAAHWLATFEGAGLDGVIAKRRDGPYRPGRRDMVKVKHRRDADCVAMGYRLHKSGEGLGSLLLGLYTDDGRLQMVGGAAAFRASQRRALLDELAPLRLGADVVRDGEASRWNSAADKRWVPIRPERVAEVAYDQMEGARFRHTVRFVRWRPDKDPADCTFAQLDVPLAYDLADVLEP